MCVHGPNVRAVTHPKKHCLSCTHFVVVVSLVFFLATVAVGELSSALGHRCRLPALSGIAAVYQRSRASLPSTSAHGHGHGHGLSGIAAVYQRSRASLPSTSALGHRCRLPALSGIAAVYQCSRASLPSTSALWHRCRLPRDTAASHFHALRWPARPGAGAVRHLSL